MSRPLVLSLFPGIGLLDRAFEEEGFTVVRGPDVLWGGDIRRFHPPSGVFDGVIGGPPCKPFSRLVHMVRANGYEVAEDLIPEFARCVWEAQPAWFLMENVEAAPPPPLVPDYRCTATLFNNRWAPESPQQNRLRRLFFGAPLPGCPPELEFDVCAFENAVWEPAVSSHAEPTPVRMAHYANGVIAVKPRDLMKRRTVAEMCELQGLPRDLLDDAPLTDSGKRAAVGNGVPLPMGRAIARAVKRAMGYPASCTILEVGCRMADMPLRTTAVEAAEARGWTKAELQRRTGLSLSLIYQLSRGARPGAKAIAAIMTAFPDLPFERLFVPVDSRIPQERSSTQQTNGNGRPRVSTLRDARPGDLILD